MEEIKHILVVSRMTTQCKQALHYGISVAKKFNASLSIIHTVHNPFGLEGWNLPTLELDYSALIRKSKSDIDAAIRAEKTDGLFIKEIIREGDSIENVVDVVREERIDLLIISAHEQGHLEHFLFGRSNEALVRRMPCSIFLVKKKNAWFGEVD